VSHTRVKQHLYVVAQQRTDFTLNTQQITDISGLRTFLTGKNVRLVAYIDSAVNIKDKTNPAFLAGTRVDAFIKTTLHTGNPGGYIVNVKNSNPVVYPDWLND
jgi:hypothetical protein